MKQENQNQEQQSFSNDPRQNLQIENELLKLKMQAERGAIFGDMEELPPEIEAQFLKNVQQFEDSFDNAGEITIYDCLGRPACKKVNELKAGEVELELRR